MARYFHRKSVMDVRRYWYPQICCLETRNEIGIISVTASSLYISAYTSSITVFIHNQLRSEDEVLLFVFHDAMQRHSVSTSLLENSLKCSPTVRKNNKTEMRKQIWWRPPASDSHMQACQVQTRSMVQLCPTRVKVESQLAPIRVDALQVSDSSQRWPLHCWEYSAGWWRLDWQWVRTPLVLQHRGWSQQPV